MTFPVIRIWLLAWDACLDLLFRKISIIHIYQDLLPNFGADGIFHWEHGLENMYIFHWGEIERGRLEHM